MMVVIFKIFQCVCPACKPLWVRRSFLRPTIMDKQRKALDACIQNFFRVSTLLRVGRERTARLFRKVASFLCFMRAPGSSCSKGG